MRSPVPRSDMLAYDSARLRGACDAMRGTATDEIEHPQRGLAGTQTAWDRASPSYLLSEAERGRGAAGFEKVEARGARPCSGWRPSLSASLGLW
eukprot:2613922-Rhodomonas_salina.1